MVRRDGKRPIRCRDSRDETAAIVDPHLLRLRDWKAAEDGVATRLAQVRP